MDIFVCFFAFFVVFKFIFAALYQLKWNFRYCCCPYYRKFKVDHEQEFKVKWKEDNLNESTVQENANVTVKSGKYVNAEDDDVSRIRYEDDFMSVAVKSRIKEKEAAEMAFDSNSDEDERYD